MKLHTILGAAIRVDDEWWYDWSYTGHQREPWQELVLFRCNLKLWDAKSITFYHIILVSLDCVGLHAMCGSVR